MAMGYISCPRRIFHEDILDAVLGYSVGQFMSIKKIQPEVRPFPIKQETELDKAFKIGRRIGKNPILSEKDILKLANNNEEEYLNNDKDLLYGNKNKHDCF